jgi:hypothetical protein
VRVYDTRVREGGAGVRAEGARVRVEDTGVRVEEQTTRAISVYAQCACLLSLQYELD